MNRFARLSRRSALAIALTVTGLVSLGASPNAAQPQGGRRGSQVNPQPVDAGLPAYAKSGDVSGAIRCAGEANVTRLLGVAGDAFRSKQAGVKPDVRGETQAAGLAALADGKADLAGCSRRLTARERSEIAAKLGAEPLEIVVALDAVEVVVNAKNPVKSLSVADLSAIFSAVPNGRSSAATWADVKVEDEKFAARKMTVFGITADEGSGGIIAGAVLAGSKFRGDMRGVATSDSVVSGVISEVGGVGYIDPYFRTASLRAVPIAAAGGSAVSCSPATIADGSYPLGRRLYVYVARTAKGPVPAHVSEFLAFLLSRDGQTAIAGSGGIPVTAALADESRKSLK